MRAAHAFRLLTLALAISPGALAQVGPDIGCVYPAGGQQGSAVRVEVAGQNLRGVKGAVVSGSGVRAELLEYARPLTQREVNALREEGQKLVRRRNAAEQFRRDRNDAGPPPREVAWSPEDQKRLATIRAKLADRLRRRQIPALAETAALRVSIASDAEVGRRELRLVTATGLSNPLVFQVGDLPEFREDEARQPAGARIRDAGPAGRAPRETRIALPAVVNGRVLAGERDRFRFAARAGQHLVVRASARELIPYLADAVPGWFQAVLTLRDARGDEIAYADDFRFDPDPVLHCEIPADGEYVVEIRDAIHRGREDFVYRIAIGELPFVTSVFPLGGSAGTPTSVAVRGWNLPVGHLRIEPDRAKGTSEVVVRDEDVSSNAVPFAVGPLEAIEEREPDDAPDSAQLVTLGCIVDGRIDTPGDVDVFRFEGDAGQEVVAEVIARRLRSPLDSILHLTDASGRQIAFDDDHEDPGAGLTTHHADSWLSAVLPESGTYYLHLADVQRHGGEEYGYRLRVGPPRPDFELRVVPSSINARAGQTVPITVYALRKDGFDGEIALRLRMPPVGFALSGARVPAGETRVQLTLTVPRAPPVEPVGLSLEGHARIAGQDVVRSAVAADDEMQAFIYHHLVPASRLLAAVTGRGGAGTRLRLLIDGPVAVPCGGSARVRIAAPRNRRSPAPVEFELVDPPPGISIQEAALREDGVELVLRADADEAEPGTKGNLIVQVYSGATRPSDAASAQRAQRRRLLGTLPAIPFDVVAGEGGTDG